MGYLRIRNNDFPLAGHDIYGIPVLIAKDRGKETLFAFEPLV